MSGVILFGFMVLFLIIGVPISITLGATTLVTLLIQYDVPLLVIPQRIFTAIDSTSIMAIPFFVLAGNFMTEGGISRRLADFANSIIGNFRGGMAYAVILACVFFAALSGSGPATVLAIGSMLYPDMIRLGYPKARAAGLLAVCGGIGPIIPPSIIMVVYCTVTGTSIGDMFTSGILVGTVFAIALGTTVRMYAKKEMWPKNDRTMTVREFAYAFFKAIPALLLPVIILGGIYSGILTPTESAAIAVVYSFLVAIFVYRELKFESIFRIILASGKSSAMMLFIIATSTAFSWLFTFSGISRVLVNGIVEMNLPATLFCLIVGIIMLIFGTFLEGIAICVLLVPVLWPIAQKLGVHPVHFGMIVAVSNIIGTMTPPVAVNIFSAASVSKLKMGEIAKGEMPFLFTAICVYAVVVFVPQFSTILLGR